MPKAVAIYRCNLCKKPFEGKSDRFYTCPCGKTEIKLHDWTHRGYTYKNDYTADLIEGKSYYLPEEFVTLSDKAQATLDEIKRIEAESKQSGYIHVHEMTEKGESGERYLSNINLEVFRDQSRYQSGINRLALRLNLNRKEGMFNHDIEERLERFLSYLKQIEDGSLNLSGTADMRKIAENTDMYETKEQVLQYDYTWNI
mgnify:CR=1 FL=1